MTTPCNDVYFQIQYIRKCTQLFKPIKTRIKLHVTLKLIYFHLVIVLSVLRLTTSDCHFSIFKICLRIFLVRIADKVFQLYFVGFFEEKLLFNQTLWTIQRHWQH